MQVQIGTHAVELKAPASFMLRREVAMAVGGSPLRAMCAALGVCWGAKPLRAKLADHKYDVLGFGGAVFDELMGLGLPEADIYAAAGEALRLCIDAPTEDGVARAEGFTGSPTGT